MSDPAPAVPRTVDELMQRACALETEAAERYAELAELMRSHHNDEVAGLFAKMARIEGLHRQQILERMGWTEGPAADAYRWRTPEGPETVDFADLHYLMTPWHALKLAEHNEQRAADFFAELLQHRELPADLREAATEMAREEREHVRLIREWLSKVPQPAPEWDADPDPPRAVD